MKLKSLVILTVVAALLIGAAVWFSGRDAAKAPRLNGVAMLPDFAVADVAAIEFGDSLKVEAASNGWVATSFHGYPAKREAIVQNLMRLSELKVGQVVRGKRLTDTTDLVLRSATGGELARLKVGERHAKAERGRYAEFRGETVLIADTLDPFENDGSGWVERKIVDEPWISFSDIVEGVAEEELGLATGAVVRVTVAGDTNRLARVGAKVKEGGSERYFRLEGSPWTFIVPGYAVEPLLGGGE